jgi:mono/diheme cytochrome c family protein
VLELLARQDTTRRRLGEALRRLANSPRADVRLQALLSSAATAEDDRVAIAVRVARTDVDQVLIADAVVSSLAGLEGTFLAKSWEVSGDGAEPKPGDVIVTEMLAAAIVRAGRPGEVEALFDRLDVPPAQFSRRHDALLSGIVSAAGESGRAGSRRKLAEAPGVLRRMSDFPEGLTRSRLDLAAALFDWPGHSTVATSQPTRQRTDAEQALFSQGRTLYLQTCAACHGSEGEGLKPLGPPLAGSEWVTGPPGRLARIVLHGLEGPVRVKGREYRPPDVLESMPSLVGLTNLQYAAVLTYVRADWGHDAPAVMPQDIRAVLKANAGRTTPWDEASLLKIQEGP